MSAALRRRGLILTLAALRVGGAEPAGALTASPRSGGQSGVVRPSPGHLIVGKAISLPSALFEAGPVGSASLISPSQAGDVARAMWRLWESALVGSDTRALSQLVAPGPMLEGEINECALPTGQCVFETVPRPVLELQTIVPLQQAYPLYFLAEIQTTEYVNTVSGLTIYTSRVTGTYARKAPGQANNLLSDLETSYGVLAYQLAQYEKRLATCVRRHASLACSKPFAVQAEHEFARFARRVEDGSYPARVQGQVDRLAATARKLTKLFEQLTTSAPGVANLTGIAAVALTLNRQYRTLVHELS